MLVMLGYWWVGSRLLDTWSHMFFVVYNHYYCRVQWRNHIFVVSVVSFTVSSVISRIEKYYTPPSFDSNHCFRPSLASNDWCLEDNKLNIILDLNIFYCQIYTIGLNTNYFFLFFVFVFCFVFVNGHCVVCSSPIQGFWLLLWYLQTLLTTYIEIEISNIVLDFLKVSQSEKTIGDSIRGIMVSSTYSNILYFHILPIPTWAEQTVFT